ncbi:hypothetical protein MKQ70_18295 [Chitinophaga sedimenti]|uniref:HD domain-containing protein n=1 Tax=Chitinophaga sedimenti TaxID=2033606 RepID=UPI0020065E3A|nr:hypothetical protein [Chitinophaga sedimenti]MCK7556860.1 hypothetical protein [Chitinophaga sedimenti]
MLGYSPAGIRKVSEWIIATKTHGDTAVDSDLSYLLDIDLGILGAPLMSYVEYTRQIRQEYRIFPDLLYNPGRKKVLKHFWTCRSFTTRPNSAPNLNSRPGKTSPGR